MDSEARLLYIIIIIITRGAFFALPFVSVKNKENDKDEDGIKRPYISGSHIASVL